MKLDRIVLVNWGQLRPGDYDLGNMTLLTGPTGAGKSTMLDGLQTIMTAAYQGIVAYNPGQEEVQQGQRSGKSKRTLESFVVGAEYSRFSRPHGAQGYMAAVFRPGPDEDSAKPFTALVAASAQVDGVGERRVPKLERLELVIVDDAALTVDDFLKDAEQSEWVAVEEIVKRLKARYSKVVTYDGHKRDYLCALYGRFRGRISITWDEAQNAAKAWCQSIAYKKIGSVHDLVRDDILEYDGKQLHESITRISDLMRQVTNLKQEGQRLEATVGRLRGLKAAIAQTASAFEEQVQYDLLLAKMLVAADDERIAQEQKRINDDSALVGRCEQKVKTEERLKAGVDRSRIDIAAKLSGIAANAEKERLDQQLELANSAARRKLAELNTGLQAAAQIVNAATGLLRKPIPEQFPKLKASVDAVGRVTASTDVARLDGLLGAVLDASSDTQLNVEKLFRLTPAFDGVEEGLGALHSYLVGTEDSVLMAVASETSELTQRVEATRKARKELADRKELLASGASDYNRDTRMALPRIRECLPEAGVQVLCDLVEPVSDEWQEAIEGYLDNARFNLIVKPEWEARTIDLLHSWGSRCKVIQGKRCLQRADAGRVPSDSIIHELRTDHPIARAYLIEQYGAVVKVRDSEQLRDTARGLTKEGKGSGSRTMFVGERRDLVLGRKAREQALRATIEQLDEADREIREFEQLQDTLSNVKRLLGNLREPVFDAVPLGQAAGEIDSTRRTLAQLDLTEVEQLRAEREKLELLIAGHDAEITAANREITLARQRITDSQGAIERINGGRDARFREREDQIRRLGQMCETNPEKTYTVIAEEVEGLLKSRRFDVHSVQVRLNTLRTQPDKLLGDVREMLAEYNANARQEERFQSALPHLHDTTTFDPYYGPLVALGRAVGALRSELEGIGLYNNRAKVEEAERSFHDVFTKQFCVEIKSKVDDGVRLLRQLNMELERLKFGTDRFSIDWSKWEPEFQEYYSFFSAVTELADSVETVDLFGETELTPKHVEVRDRLVKLLLDSDQERAGRELLRIADYRNYRRYEIWNDSDSGGRIALSTWGTGSGGQLETPAYIVRAAVVTNRLKLFDKGPSLKMLVSDESFSTMDEPRARAVLQYLRDSLDIQVVSAMPTRGAGGLRPEFDREYSYSRVPVDANGELDFILEYDERIFKKDKMRELWEKQRAAARAQAELAFGAAEAAQQAEALK
ncbi:MULTISPECIES: SbcC/MukB-like Walker B domain-containing protein [Burkholderia]|uniref:AAA family ATPase n=2 Tax=Burkholderia contaminans TaxID=488447 RepID=A0A1E3FR78_9BURK|nr:MULTISPECIES: SbcC/MukB-like Walker B domain-containing protein [Burkholderia]UTP22864.1 AAA family ATPase [Burkholderia sp. FXe9]KKL43186.1 ATPase AAA [Burkholderia contaminans LMG 23361]MBH9694736.1 AAA family ATPase [Burkholderia contaminans]MBK1901892.1 AAA family ATPase [Burkholderia contaminans]MBK1910175.1 AAA family ATPase [Burkholderia contaminans]